VLSEIFRATWGQAYRGIIPHLHLESMIRRRNTEWWQATIRSGQAVLTMQVGAETAGYATLGTARVRGEQEGEIYELYVLPTHQGLGFGEHLFEACRHHLDTQRLRGLLVWALADNTPAARRAPGRARLRAIRQQEAQEDRFRLGLTPARGNRSLDAIAASRNKRDADRPRALRPVGACFVEAGRVRAPTCEGRAPAHFRFEMRVAISRRTFSSSAIEVTR
jgi:GNAT superfamily N-acetyltransferase